MRRKNWRVAGTGLVLIGVAAAFFFGMAMLSSAPRVHDPAAMMQTVGTVSGAAAGIGLAMFIFGIIGRKARRRHPGRSPSAASISQSHSQPANERRISSR
jgi:membrane protein YqaA with SNARE-associated domain